MPRDSSGNYTLPIGNPVIDGTVIDVDWANPTMADIAVQLNNVLTRDGLLGYTVPNPALVDLANTADLAKGDALVGVRQPFTGAVARTQHTKNAERVSIQDFGAIGTGAETDAEINSTAFELAFAALQTTTLGFGTVEMPYGQYVLARPVDVPLGFTLEGDGSTDNVGATQLRGHNIHGPVIRVRNRHVRLRNFTVASTNQRRTSQRVTGANYAGLGLTRDDINFGIWVEGNDDPAADVTDCELNNVWSFNQPNDAVVFVGKGYGSRMISGGFLNPIGHGIVVDRGGYTNRVNQISPALLRIEDVQGSGATGHGLAVSRPTDPVGAIRILVDNLDVFNCGSNPALLYQPFVCFFFADNSYINNSGVNGNVEALGGIYIAGRNSRLVNNRCLATNQPMFVGNSGSGPRITHGIFIDGVLVSQTAGAPYTETVKIESSAVLSVAVKLLSGDGFVTEAASDTALERQLDGSRKWSGSLDVDGALLSNHHLGRIIAANNDTKYDVKPRLFAGFMLISADNASNSPPSTVHALIYYDVGASVNNIKLVGGAGIDVVNVGLNGTTGAVGKVTVGAPGVGGIMHIENRLGSITQIYYTFLN